MDREAFYEDPEKRLKFLPNPQDGPSAYDVLVGNDSFYIPDRVLNNIASPGISTRRVQSALETMAPTKFPYILKRNNLSYESLHVALLQVRLKEEQDYAASLVSTV